MKVGLFDHIGRADRPLAQLYDERLEFYGAADEAGFWGVHIAEHHCSPINMAPSPNLFLAALARQTRNIRLGPLCYLLTLYSPLRMIEEISMLDHLSRGRLEVGIGRGVSPFELGYHNVDHSKSRDMFIDAFRCISAGMAADTLDYSGPYYTYKGVPIELRPLQHPAPAFWYGSSNTTGAAWAGEHGMHFVANGPTDFARGNIAAFQAALERRGGAASPKAGFSGGCAVGALRQIVVADTDEEALRIARPASHRHHEDLNWLRTRHGINEFTARLNVPRAATLEGMMREGTVIAGSPETVVAAIGRQVAALGINYLVAYMMFGDMSLADSLRSLRLFAGEVMPKIAHL
jgi:alkanesulfonate monooxygenase SsuD/methylene tetrahydromethanopterin reductase-like flavin-dependent oxidoreductase (luciferase family)